MESPVIALRRVTATRDLWPNHSEGRVPVARSLPKSANISKSTVSPNGYSLVQTCEPGHKGVELDTLMMQLSGAVSVPPRPTTVPLHRQRKPSAEKLCRTKTGLVLILFILLLLFLGWRFLLRSYLLPYTMTNQELADSKRTTTPRPDINRPPEMTWNESELLHRPTPTEDNEVLGTEFFQIQADLPPDQPPNHQVHQKIHVEHFPGFQRYHPKEIGRFGGFGTYTTTTSTSTTTPQTTTRWSDEAEEKKKITTTTATPKPFVVVDNEEDVRPVEMSFGDDDWSMDPIDHHEEHQLTVNKHFKLKSRQPDQFDTPEPVWRIKPADLPDPPPPPKPVLNIQATMKTYETQRHPQKPKTVVVTQGEDPLKNTPVIVTALLDIGRGSWERFTRPYDIYLNYMMDLLKIKNRVMIYCDKAAKQFLHQQDLNWNTIQITEIQMSDLPFYKFHDEISEILEDEQRHWNKSWDLKVKSHPEALYADYNILVNSKPYFLFNATKISYFEADNFVWIDAGYSHGSKDIIPQGLWNPKLPKGKITLVKITPEIDKTTRYTLDLVYRKQWTVVSGGVIAGDKNSIRRLNMFFFKTFLSLLDQRKVDDDQTTLLMTIRDYYGMFNILTGGWFDAFKLIPLKDNLIL
ncbi:unnamed protein product [Bursaphelenchus xylophilus]|uniref:(pine wood nematode) hypothetical protein n=1 Tax=Bursaphelenchus xylophilus TaxID=6326 RepID=A0A7I8X5Y7_BURXY|nr:unnamed protein product [Bursaphelenchus xylophilus]CAG9122684.1 unnamed protein product [Bursaphelenchus xylophilus]